MAKSFRLIRSKYKYDASCVTNTKRRNRNKRGLNKADRQILKKDLENRRT